jgi:peptidoglycan-associated lipoprotein
MTLSRKKDVALLLLVLSMLFAISCKKAAPPPPPPPAASTPAPPPPAPVITLRAQPDTINRGQNTMLQWDARNAASVQIDPDIGQVAATGNRQINPASSVTYTAMATGPGGTATDTARITVNIPAAPPAAPPPPRPRTPDVTISELFQRNVQDIFFDYDKADIRADQVSKLQTAAAWLRENGNVRFTIEGHHRQLR